MTHKQIVETCEGIGLTVRSIPADGRKSYEATDAQGNRVYWSTSTEGGLIGLPRVVYNGRDSHAETLREIKYLVNIGRHSSAIHGLKYEINEASANRSKQ